MKTWFALGLLLLCCAGSAFATQNIVNFCGAVYSCPGGFPTGLMYPVSGTCNPADTKYYLTQATPVPGSGNFIEVYTFTDTPAANAYYRLTGSNAASCSLLYRFGPNCVSSSLGTTAIRNDATPTYSSCAVGASATCAFTSTTPTTANTYNYYTDIQTPIAGTTACQVCTNTNPTGTAIPPTTCFSETAVAYSTSGQALTSSCFTGDTLVRLVDGSMVAITNLTVGSQVLSGTGQSATVLAVGGEPVSTRKLVSINKGDNFATSDHAFVVHGQDDTYASYNVGQLIANQPWIANNVVNLDVGTVLSSWSEEQQQYLATTVNSVSAVDAPISSTVHFYVAWPDDWECTPDNCPVPNLNMNGQGWMTYSEQQFDFEIIPAYYLITRLNKIWMSTAYIKQILSILPVYDLPDINMIACVLKSVYTNLAISTINSGLKHWPVASRPTGYSQSVPQVDSQWLSFQRSFYANRFRIPNITADMLQDPSFPSSSVYSNTPSKRSTQTSANDFDDGLFAFLDNGEPLDVDPYDELATSIPPGSRQVSDEGILKQIIASGSHESIERRAVSSSLSKLNLTAFIQAHQSQLYALSLLGYTTTRQDIVPNFLWLNYVSYENARGFIRDVVAEAPVDFWSNFQLSNLNGYCGGFDASKLTPL